MAVRNYTDQQLFNRAKTLPSFKHFPGGYWAIGVRSASDEFDAFDDKFYLYNGLNFIMVTSCTLNPGGPTLLGGWKEYNKQGAAILKGDEWYYDCYAPGLHKGKMRCLRQVKPMKYYRDGNNDQKVDEIGEIYTDNYGTHIHFAKYSLFDKIEDGLVRLKVGPWSAGCTVLNDEYPYEKLITLTENVKSFTMCVLREFDVK